jgi:hypothetical protein
VDLAVPEDAVNVEEAVDLVDPADIVDPADRADPAAGKGSRIASDMAYRLKGEVVSVSWCVGDGAGPVSMSIACDARGP